MLIREKDALKDDEKEIAMNRNNPIFKKLMTAVIAAAFCLTAAGAFLTTPEPAYADGAEGPVNYAPELNAMLDPLSDYPDWLGIKIGKLVKKPPAIKVKSSDPSVAKPARSTKRVAYVKLRNPGTADLKIKVKTKKKTRTFKCHLTVLPYENPFQSLRIGDLELASYLDQGLNPIFHLSSPVTGPLNISAKDGWEVESINYFRNYLTNDPDYDLSEDIDIYIQNGVTISLYPDDPNQEWYAGLYITMTNPSLGITLETFVGPFPEDEED